MSELLTRDDYAAIAGSLAPATNAWIDGAYRPARSGATFVTTNPATGETLARVAACDAEDVDFAVGRAREAFADGRWSARHPSERKAVLIRLAKLMERARHELAADAGLPRGVLNVVTGFGPEVGEPLGRHADVDMVAFTGSTDTGRRFLHYAAESNLKKVVLECGGKNPCIVMDDAEELDVVAMHVVNGAFWNMGENCSATSRLIVHRDVKAELLERVVARTREWRTGDPLDPANRLGALVDAEHHARVCRYVEQGAAAGRVLLGGATDEAPFVRPTIVEGVATDHPFVREEIFGPVLSVIEVGSLEEAVAVVNDTEYGLAAALFCANGKRALRAARAIRAGTVTLNSFGEGDLATPFGGYKASGFGGRDKSVFAHEQYTELKTIWIDLADEGPMERIG